MTITYLSDVSQYNKSREYLEYPVEEQRFLFYHNRIYDFRLLKMIETETSVYWIEDKYKPMFTNKLFYFSKGDSGITLDKKTRDVKIWYGKYPSAILIDSFYAYNNVNPSEIFSEPFRRYFTKSLAKDIAKGKIHSIDDYAVFLSKKTMFFRGIDPKVLSKLIHHQKMDDLGYIDIKDLSRLLSVTNNKEAMINYIVERAGSFWGLMDLAKEALAVNEKINIHTSSDILSEKKRIRSISSILIDKYNITNDIPF